MQKQKKEQPQINKNRKKKKNKGWNSTLPQDEPNQSETQLNREKQVEKIIQKNVQLLQNTKDLPFQTKKLVQMSKKYFVQTSFQLGHGFASVVYLGQNILTHEAVCVKVIDYTVLGGERAREALNRQIKYLNRFNCEQIVKLLDVYQSPSFCYLVMQFCPGGDLFKFLMRSQPLHPLLVRKIIHQISVGLLQLQKNQLIHRDLKTQNIFLGKNFDVKIGDLGFCVTASQQNIVHNVGSPIYMSPQVLSGGKHSFSSDVYGLGVIWYELLHKKAPWQAKTQQELLNKKINQNQYLFKEDVIEGDRNLICKCLSIQMEQRCSLKQIIQYMNQMNDLQMKELMKSKQKQQNIDTMLTKVQSLKINPIQSFQM